MAQHSTSHSSPTAVSYAQALLDLATEQGQAEAAGQELTDLRTVLDEYPAFAEFLRNPGIGGADRTAAMDRVLRGRISPLLWNFLRVLNGKGRLGLLHQIADAYDDLLDQRVGRVEVDLTVAQRLDDAQVEQVRQRVSEALGKQAIVHQYVDESIIGGIVLRVQDKLIDASVRQQLVALRQRLLTSRPKAGGVA